MVTGSQTIDGKSYVFASTGELTQGTAPGGTPWEIRDGNTYYKKSDGSYQTGWLNLNGIWYYFEAEGRRITGWKQVGPAWYYFDPGRRHDGRGL